MEDNFLTRLPPEIAMEILSRLPIRSMTRCKSVHKSWRDLIEAPDFVNLYKPAPCLAIAEGRGSERPKKFKVYEVLDETKYTKKSCRRVFAFRFADYIDLHSSANGLILCKSHWDDLFICNPVTREFIDLPTPPGITCGWLSYGFGVSKTSGQYKIVRILSYKEYKGYGSSRHFRCQVYTLGTGSWRVIDSAPPLELVFTRTDRGGVFLNMSVTDRGAFLNGSYHWFAHDPSEGRPWICCFDLETEVFTLISPPPQLDARKYNPDVEVNGTLFTSGGRLGLCDCTFYIHIWLMNEYGDERSWSKRAVVNKSRLLGDNVGCVYVVKLFENGDILLENEAGRQLVCYFNKTKTCEVTRLSYYCDGAVVVYTPSTLSLKTLSLSPMEIVSSSQPSLQWRVQ